MTDEPQHRRSIDSLIGKCKNLWDWFDNRQIDRHIASVAIFAVTWKLTEWAMTYAALHPDKPGLEVAAIIAALTGPWSLAQAAALKFYFDSRDKP